jgi:hypothetical protein
MRLATRPLAAGLLLVLLVLVAGCTPGATHRAASATPRPTTATTVSATQPQAGAGRLGAAGCRPPSPVTPLLQSGQQAGIEVHGTARGAELWALPFAPVPLPVGEEVKIVWRMTGSGPLRITATRSDGTAARRTFGPEEHGGSNWNRPGDEWGTGFVFPGAGCWDLRLVRTSGSGDVWLVAR